MCHLGAGKAERLVENLLAHLGEVSVVEGGPAGQQLEANDAYPHIHGQQQGIT